MTNWSVYLATTAKNRKKYIGKARVCIWRSGRNRFKLQTCRVFDSWLWIFTSPHFILVQFNLFIRSSNNNREKYGGKVRSSKFACIFRESKETRLIFYLQDKSVIDVTHFSQKTRTDERLEPYIELKYRPKYSFENDRHF